MPILVLVLLLVAFIELSFFCYVFFSLFIANRKAGEEVVIPPLFQPKLRTVKRKPKSVSEEEQWRKEQREAPMDPGF